MAMTDDPFDILGVSERANDTEIREAYLRGVLLHPPDRDPEGFQRVRRAFEAISDRRKRASWRLFWKPDATSLEDLVTGATSPVLRYVGPEPWVAVLRSATPPDAEEGEP